MTTEKLSLALEGAIASAKLGWRQFPVNDQKVPYEEGWQQFATTDEPQIRAWATKYPGCNFGTTANPDQLIVDLDEKHGKHGIQDLKDLEAIHGAMPSTRTVRTPTGGVHLYFKTNRQIRNTVGRIRLGIDIRGFLTYVVSPGSSVKDGSYVEIKTDPPAQIPEWFLVLGEKTAKDPLGRPDDSEVVGSIPEGKRDNELTRWAGMLRGQGLVADEMEAALLSINQTRCTVPLPDADVMRIAHSIGKKPRGAAQAISDFSTETIPPESVLDTVSASAVLARTIPPPNQCLADFCDMCDVLGIFGKSKAKKSWAMMQMAFSLATGTPFLHLEVPNPRKVLLVQLEVHRDHFERRVQMLAAKLSPEARAKMGNLHILHGRSKKVSLASLSATAKALGCEALFIDPIYPLFPEGENSAEDVRPLMLEIGGIADSGMFVVYSHHDAKGISGDRALVDRGSGSGLMARAYDCAAAIDPHADDPDAMVFRFTARSYQAPEDTVARWSAGEFSLAHDLAPTPRTSASESKKRNAGTPLSETAEKIIGFIPETGATMAEIRSRTVIGLNRLRGCLKFLESLGRVKLVKEGENHEKRAFILPSYPLKTENKGRAADFNLDGLI